MAGRQVQAISDAMLNHLYRATAYTPSVPISIGLFEDAAGDPGTPITLLPQQQMDFAAASGAQSKNSNTVILDPDGITAIDGTVAAHFGLYDTGGTRLLVTGPLSSSVTLYSGDTDPSQPVRFLPNSITVGVNPNQSVAGSEASVAHSNYAIENWLDLLLRGDPFASPTNIYLALYSGNLVGDPTAPATEWSGGNYARADITGLFDAPEAHTGNLRRIIQNALIEFTDQTDTPVGSWGILDAASLGNLLGMHDVEPDLPVTGPATIEFPNGEIYVAVA